jgi:acyl-CoA thioesterase
VTQLDSDRQALAERSVAALYATDRASQALGIRILTVGRASCTVAMTVRPDMVNGHGTCHGGLLFTLGDSAFAFACNTGGETTVAASASIDFLAAAREGDELTASARELWKGGRSGLYEITITNQTGAQIALFRGRSHRLASRDAPAQDAP